MTLGSVAENSQNSRSGSIAHVKNFTGQLEKWTMTAACGKKYVRVHELKNWFRERCLETNHITLEQILKKLYSESSWWELAMDDESSPIDVILGILITINRPWDLIYFQKHNIFDADLPINFGVLKEKIVDDLKLTDGEKLVNDFYNT